MQADVDRIPTFFAAWLSAHGSAGPCGEVALWLSSGELDPSSFSAIIVSHGVSREPWFRADMLDLVLDYARERLSQGLLTIDDIADIQLLKRTLHVGEGEFVDKARYLLRYDSTSDHLRGTLNGVPFWAVRQDVVRPERCIPVP